MREHRPGVDQNTEYDRADEYQRNDYRRAEEASSATTNQTSLLLLIGNNPRLAIRRRRSVWRITYRHRCNRAGGTATNSKILRYIQRPVPSVFSLTVLAAFANVAFPAPGLGYRHCDAVQRDHFIICGAGRVGCSGE